MTPNNNLTGENLLQANIFNSVLAESRTRLDLSKQKKYTTNTSSLDKLEDGERLEPMSQREKEIEHQKRFNNLKAAKAYCPEKKVNSSVFHS